MDFIERVLEIQKILGIKRKEMAEILGISAPSLSDILNKKTKPSLNTILSLCNICKKNRISIEWLMTGEEKEKLSKEDSELLTAYHAANTEAKEIVKFTLKIGQKDNRILEGEKSSISKTG